MKPSVAVEIAGAGSVVAGAYLLAGPGVALLVAGAGLIGAAALATLTEERGRARRRRA